ncbi:hypothetical protein TM48_05138 [Mycobacterium shottsii]|nr:hypothetical protein TM48_05138 [Mycobacterium shottsii]
MKFRNQIQRPSIPDLSNNPTTFSAENDKMGPEAHLFDNKTVTNRPMLSNSGGGVLHPRTGNRLLA